MRLAMREIQNGLLRVRLHHHISYRGLQVPVAPLIRWVQSTVNNLMMIYRVFLSLTSNKLEVPEGHFAHMCVCVYTTVSVRSAAITAHKN